MTLATRSSVSPARVDRLARTSVRVAIVVVLATLGSVVSVAAAHAAPAGTATNVGAVHTKGRSR